MRKKLSLLFALLFAVVVSAGLFIQQHDAALTPRAWDDLPSVQTADNGGAVQIVSTQSPSSATQKDREGEPGFDSPNMFAEWENGIRTRFGAAGPDYPQNYQFNELLKARYVSSTRELGLLKAGSLLPWTERGPGNVAGRTRAILVDPNDATLNTWIVGSVGGGVWKTTDAGQTWTHLTAALPNLATSTLAWSPSATNTIYVGTGEGFGNVDQIDGSGIWKTTDGGATWSQLISTVSNPDFENVMRLLVDPANANVVLAAVAPGFNRSGTTSGIYRSTDGGATWSKTYTSTGGDVQQIVADPNNFSTQYGAVNGTGVIKSTDGGQTWASSSSGIGSVGRLEIAVAPSNSNTVYLAAQGGSSGSVLYISNDAGATWIPGSDPSGDKHWLNGQGWYDNAIAVDPYDASNVFVAGVNILNLQVQSTTDTTEPQVQGIDFENTGSFLSFINFGGSLAGGGIDFGSETPSVSIEVRFGPGISQKAHRFLVPVGATSGVPASQYTYQDYVDVPFQLWDIDNNQQLMVSFRDQSRNGKWELIPWDGGTNAREYVFLSAEPYNPNAPSPSIAQTGGHQFRQLYFIWPVLANGGSFDPNNLPASTLRIRWGPVITQGVATNVVTDGNGQFGGGSKGVHVDHHNLTIVKTNEATQSFRLFNGNDGGVSYTDDRGLTFTQTGDAFGNGLNGYNTSQFYGVDKAHGMNRYIGGSQDNGSWFSLADPDNTSDWASAPSGDGFEAVWHYDKPDYMLESSQGNSIRQSKNGGNGWNSVDPPETGSSPFFTKIAKSKQDPDLVFAVGSSGVWRSDDFADSWTLTPAPSPGWNGSSSFSQVKIHLHNPQIVWAGQSMVAQSPLFVSIDGGLTFNATNVFSDVTMGRVSGLETHPTDDNTAFALFSFRGAPKILKTTDLGQTWSDISGFGTNSTSSNGFPDVAVYSLLVMPFNTNWIWAGTEIGLFESTDGGATWAFANNGAPNAAIYEMLIVDDQVVIATHGRGVWSLTMPELAGYEPAVATLAPRLKSALGGAGGVISVGVLLPSAYDSASVLIDGAQVLTTGGTAAGTDTSLVAMAPVADIDTVSVQIAGFKDGKMLKSAPTLVTVYALTATQSGYFEDFNDKAADFVLAGGAWKINKRFRFNDAALQSPHNYPDNANMLALLKIKIRVADTPANLSYDDIAIIEPGSPGAAFGFPPFKDYVVVEGSKDNGATWIPLGDGYDARFDTGWLATWNQGLAVTPDLFRSHQINLLDFFQTGDEIVLRWRLFSDDSNNGFGWMVDNIAVQRRLVSVESEEQLPQQFSLSRNYPNPFNPTTKLNYALPRTAEVNLTIYNINGQKIRELVSNEKKAAGRYTVEWDGTDQFGRAVSSGVYFYRIKAGDFSKSFKMTLLK